MPRRLLLYVVACAGCVWPCRAGYDPELKVEAARLYGDLEKYMYWFMDVLVGEPPQRVSVILDSGSSLLAFPCTGCSHCGSEHIDPMFNFSKSTTASWLACDQCHGHCNTDRRCTYSQPYVEGSKIRGVLFEDLLSLGDTIQNNPPVKAKLGCHVEESKLFYSQAANGILGIEGADSVIHTYYQDRKDIASNIMAICLAHHGGHFSIGGYNRSRHIGDVQWLPQLDAERFLVNLKKLEVGGTTLTEGFGRALIDSGTSYTYFTQKNYDEVVKGIEEVCAEGKCGQSVGNRLCWRSPSLLPFPTIFMYFGDSDTKVKWQPWNYLRFEKRSKRWCYAFEGSGTAPRTTLGASWMIGKDVIFDKGSRKIGVVDANCPEYRDRPAPPQWEQDKSTSTTRSSRSSTTTTAGEDPGPATKATTPATKATVLPQGAATSSSTTATAVNEGTQDTDDFMTELTDRPTASIFGAADFVDQLWQDGPMFISVFFALALLMCCFTRMCLKTFERARRLRQDGEVF